MLLGNLGFFPGPTLGLGGGCEVIGAPAFHDEVGRGPQVNRTRSVTDSPAGFV